MRNVHVSLYSCEEEGKEILERHQILEDQHDVCALIETLGYDRSSTKLGTDGALLVSVHGKKWGEECLFYDYLLSFQVEERIILVLLSNILTLLRFVQRCSFFVERITEEGGIAVG